MVFLWLACVRRLLLAIVGVLIPVGVFTCQLARADSDLAIGGYSLLNEGVSTNNLRYELAVTNLGPSTASNVLVSARIPAYVTPTLTEYSGAFWDVSVPNPLTNVDTNGVTNLVLLYRLNASGTGAAVVVSSGLQGLPAGQRDPDRGGELFADYSDDHVFGDFNADESEVSVWIHVTGELSNRVLRVSELDLSPSADTPDSNEGDMTHAYDNAGDTNLIDQSFGLNGMFDYAIRDDGLPGFSPAYRSADPTNQVLFVGVNAIVYIPYYNDYVAGLATNSLNPAMFFPNTNYLDGAQLPFGTPSDWAPRTVYYRLYQSSELLGDRYGPLSPTGSQGFKRDPEVAFVDVHWASQIPDEITYVATNGVTNTLMFSRLTTDGSNYSSVAAVGLASTFEEYGDVVRGGELFADYSFDQAFGDVVLNTNRVDLFLHVAGEVSNRVLNLSELDLSPSYDSPDSNEGDFHQMYNNGGNTNLPDLSFISNGEFNFFLDELGVSQIRPAYRSIDDTNNLLYVSADKIVYIPDYNQYIAGSLAPDLVRTFYGTNYQDSGNIPFGTPAEWGPRPFYYPVFQATSLIGEEDPLPVVGGARFHQGDATLSFIKEITALASSSVSNVFFICTASTNNPAGLVSLTVNTTHGSHDPNVTNDSIVVQTAVSPDLCIEGLSVPSIISTSHIYSYVITVTNNGPYAALNARIREVGLEQPYWDAVVSNPLENVATNGVTNAVILHRYNGVSYTPVFASGLGTSTNDEGNLSRGGELFVDYTQDGVFGDLLFDRPWVDLWYWSAGELSNNVIRMNELDLTPAPNTPDSNEGDINHIYRTYGDTNLADLSFSTNGVFDYFADTNGVHYISQARREGDPTNEYLFVRYSSIVYIPDYNDYIAELIPFSAIRIFMGSNYQDIADIPFGTPADWGPRGFAAPVYQSSELRGLGPPSLQVGGSFEYEGLTNNGIEPTYLGDIPSGGVTSVVLQAVVETNAPYPTNILFSVETMHRRIDPFVTNNLAIINTPIANSDGDALPDYVDPDDDNDGASDASEAVAGTDRTDASSVLKMGSVHAGPSNVTFVWYGGTSATQVIEWASNLAAGAVWTGIYTNMPPTSVTNMLSTNLFGTNSHGYLRVRVDGP